MKLDNVNVCLVFVVMLVFASGLSLAGTATFPAFFDDFESYNEGDEIDLKIPPIGYQWIVNGGVYDKFVIVTDIVADGNNALRTERTNPSAGLYGTCDVPTFSYEGMTLIVEHDVYFPSETPLSLCGLLTGSSPGLSPMGWVVLSNDTWRYWTDDPGNYIDSGIIVLRDAWNHVKMEMYDDFTWTMTVTNDIVGETVICENVSWASGVGYWNSLRNFILPQQNIGAVEYWDNMQITGVDNQAQGYPPIYEVPEGIVIDGSIDSNEWDGVKKVATKPNGSRGNFKIWEFSGFHQLEPNTVADVYMGYDSNSFYIAHRIINAACGDEEHNTGFDAVFTWESESSADGNDVSYIFNCTASECDVIGPNDLVVGKYTGHSPQPQIDESFDPNIFWDNGGQMDFSIVDGVFEAEMKIPFVTMPDFTGPAAGEKVNVQFNARDRSGTGTTNVIFQVIPWWHFFGDVGVGPMVGVAFPDCGDEDHPYPKGDVSENCHVDYADIAVLALHWLECAAPECD